MASLNSFFPQIDQYDPKPMMEQNRQNALLDLQQKTFGMQQNKFAQEQTDAANARKQEAAMKIGQAALTIQTEPEFNALRDFAVQNGFPEAAQYTFQQLPQIRAMFEQSGAFTGDSFQAQQANALVAREVASGVPIEQAKANVAAKMLERVVPISAGGGVYAYDRFASGVGNATAQPNMPNSAAGAVPDPPTPGQMESLVAQTPAGQGLNRSATGSMTPLIAPRTPEQQIEQKRREAEAVKQGQNLAENQQNAAKAISAGNNALTVINQLIDENGALKPGVDSIVGGFAGLQGRQSAAMPLTENQRKYQPFVDQIKGQAFLQAFEALKGGGQITEVEGQKATDAIVRLAQYQDEASFTAALKELRGIVQNGLSRAQANAGASPTPPAQMPAAPAATGNVVRWEDLP